ncbi:MAG: glycosyltransferase family 39 protein [Bacteroidia bacterium]|nr:glycosyltransferase family 39 protein [Bacteroidia bacterium]|tara:strand:- start:4096 stop:5520 length:1425 start_codon:yes stop_codon:yes gene_type:complete
MKLNSYIIPFLFFILNILFRWVAIEFNSLAGDEPFSVYYAQMDITDIVRHLKSGNNPPLYEIFLHYWTHWFGIGVVAVRIPSLIFTALTATYIFKLGNEFFSKAVGITSAFTYTLSNYATLFSHEARVYALFGLLTILSFYFFLRWLNDQTSKGDGVILSIIYALLMYSHYFGIMVVGLQFGIGIIIKNSDHKSLKRYGLIMLGSVMLFSPYLYILFVRMFDSLQSGTWLSPPNGWASMSHILNLFLNSKNLVKCFIALTILSLLLWGFRSRVISKNTVVVLCWFFVPFFGMFFISYSFPMFHDRYLMHAFVGFVFFVGIVITSFFKNDWLNGVVIFVFLGSLFINVVRNIDNGRHTKSAVEYVQSERDSNTRIILYPKFKILGYAYYFNRNRFKNFDQEYGFFKVAEGFKEENIYAINQYSEARIDSNCQKLIFMMTDAGPKDQLLSDFSHEFELERTEHFPAFIDVYSFKRK